MQEISEKTLREALHAAEGEWQEMPFPADKIPEGHSVRSVQGRVGPTIFLAVEFTLPDGQIGYDGTFTSPPVICGHLPSAVSKEAFLKGWSWLEKKKTAQ